MAQVDIHGIINIDKPKGLTSHDVVARVRRITGQRKTGHAGTLDPMATGVLPLALGKATRLVEYLADADKAYRATLYLGATSETYDAEGTITSTPEAPTPTRDAVENALNLFRGAILQIPPMHSAIKVGGQKLYDLARQGLEIERQARAVVITRLDLEVYKPPTVQLFVECAKGTYIRSLAHDLGVALGTGAYLTALIRTRHGPFTLDAAITLEGLETAFKEGTWHETLTPADTIISGWPRHVATPEEGLRIRQGKLLQAPPPLESGDGRLAAYTQEGELLAILYWDEEKSAWQPKKVFA